MVKTWSETGRVGQSMAPDAGRLQMVTNRFAALLTLTVVLTLVPPSAVAQSTDRTMPMRTPDGVSGGSGPS